MQPSQASTEPAEPAFTSPPPANIWVSGSLRAGALVFAVSFVVFALSPVITNYDSYSSFPTAVSLVNHHTLSLQPFKSVPTLAHSYTVSLVHGRLMTGYPWVAALAFVPTVVAIDLLHLLGGPSADHLVVANQMGIVQMETASFIVALACAVLAVVAFERVSGDARARLRCAVVVGLLFAFGTSAWSLASRSLWQQAPGFLCVAGGLLNYSRITSRPERGARYAAFAGALFSLAVAVRPTNAIALGIGLLLLAARRRREATAFLVGSLVILIPWMVVTHAAFGTWLQPYDMSDHRGINSAFLDALAANLVSPARGILIFSPLCLLAIPGARLARRAGTFDATSLLSALAIPCYLVLVSAFTAGWWGGNTYGPRLMSDAFPFIFLLALPVAEWARSNWRESTSKRAIAGIALVSLASVAFNAEGGVLRSTTCWNGKPGTSHNVDEDPGRVWSWSDPQFLSGFRSLTTLSIHRSILSTCFGPGSSA
jgi:hypothetical protein